MLKKRLIAIAKKDIFEIQWDYQETSTRSNFAWEEKFYEAYTKDKLSTLLHVGFLEASYEGTVSVSYVLRLCHHFTDYLLSIPDLIAQKSQVSFDMENSELEAILTQCGFMLGQEYIDVAYLRSFMKQLFAQYQLEIMQWNYDVEGFLGKYAHRQSAGRIFFHMVEHDDGDEPFAFLATYAKYNEEHKIKHIPLQLALKEYEHDKQALLKLLQTVYQVGQTSTFIQSLVDSGELFQTLKLNVQEAYTLLKEIPLYEENGIICRVPKWLKSNQHHMKVNVAFVQSKKVTIGMRSLMDFDVKIAIGGECLSMQELRILEKESQGLAYIKGKWIEINQEELTQVLATYQTIEKDLKKGISIRDAMRWQLGIGDNASFDTSLVEVQHGSWLEQLKNTSGKQGTYEVVEKLENTHLRAYQIRGVQWLMDLHDMGFGACLADDMGLGKTIQVLVAIQRFAQMSEKTLLIIPASLIGNWLDEIQRFTPDLRVFVYHRYLHAQVDESSFEAYDIVITTYQMLVKCEGFMSVQWDNLILDEAQMIKNPMSKQTRQIKALHAVHRFALTGTPIENHVCDLWSLFDFLNPGLLGSMSEFKRFMKDGKTNQYARLKQITSPFILRRLKSDKSILGDLPEKMEIREYTQLSKKQIVLYRQLIKDLKRYLQESEGIQRKGLILSFIIKCKQVCNHPDQYLGNSMYLPEESGKFLRLKQLCEVIYEQRERVLVFTQFKEMVEPLANYLQTIFHQKGVLLHGGISVKKRHELVEKFQGEAYVPYMVLSIKAGGVGLNLTKASHVIHFDRWWNPAVENQASDRAYRIGQKNNVLVHKFISEGTIEKQIDELIYNKLQMVDEILTNQQEVSITQMSNQEILALFSLQDMIL